MIKTQTCGKIETNNKWFICPQCRKQKLARLLPTTEAKDLPLFCKRCNREVVVNIPNEPEP